MGPFAMGDLAGLDVGYRVRKGKRETMPSNQPYSGTIADRIVEIEAVQGLPLAVYRLDGSLFVTSAGVNPTRTIQALALYVADQMKQRLANLFD